MLFYIAADNDVQGQSTASNYLLYAYLLTGNYSLMASKPTDKRFFLCQYSGILFYVVNYHISLYRVFRVTITFHPRVYHAFRSRFGLFNPKEFSVYARIARLAGMFIQLVLLRFLSSGEFSGSFSVLIRFFVALLTLRRVTHQWFFLN